MVGPTEPKKWKKKPNKWEEKLEMADSGVGRTRKVGADLRK